MRAGAARRRPLPAHLRRQLLQRHDAVFRGRMGRKQIVDAVAGQSLLLRKFDESDRDQQKIDGQLQFTFADVFTATPSAAYRYDNYFNSRLGLQTESAWSAGIDLSWTPLERVTFSGGYTFEQILQQMESRSRPVNGTVTLDASDFDWISNLTDTVDTSIPGLKLPTARSAAAIATSANWSAIAGMNQRRYWPASLAVSASALMATE